MPGRAILQIGTEKTGTTSLQLFLSRNRETLRRRGFVYPRFCGSINQTGLAAYAMAPERSDPLRHEFGIHAPGDVAPMRRRMRTAAALELEGGETAIFCNEHCHSRLTDAGEVSTLRAFLGEFFDDIQVMVYLRRQDQVAVSLHSTRLKSGSTDPRILPAARAEDPYYNYDRSLALWEACFGAENVTVRLFDRAELAGGSVITDFLRAWNIGEPSDFHPIRDQNESISPEAQDFLRLLNAHLAPVPGLPLSDVTGPLAASLAEHFPGSGAKPARAAARAFFETFRASNERVRARYFPGRPRLFGEDFSGYPETASRHETSLEDFARIAARLQSAAARDARRLEAEIAIRDARLAWERGDPAGAHAALDRAAAWLPGHAPVHRVRGEYLLREGRDADAAGAARRAAELCPESGEYWHFLGVIERRLGNLSTAREAQMRALERDPGLEAARTCLEDIAAAMAKAGAPGPAAKSA